MLASTCVTRWKRSRSMERVAKGRKKEERWTKGERERGGGKKASTRWSRGATGIPGPRTLQVVSADLTHLLLPPSFSIRRRVPFPPLSFFSSPPFASALVSNRARSPLCLLRSFFHCRARLVKRLRANTWAWITVVKRRYSMATILWSPCAMRHGSRPREFQHFLALRARLRLFNGGCFFFIPCFVVGRFKLVGWN